MGPIMQPGEVDSLLRAYKDKTHPEHEERVEWAGEYFAPERFDIAEVNELLRAI